MARLYVLVVVVGAQASSAAAMEDAHSTVLRMGEDDENAFFAVYDGHAGQSSLSSLRPVVSLRADDGTISSFASTSVWHKLREHAAYRQKEYARAFEDAFVDTDADIRAKDLGRDAGGATAIALLYTTDEEVYVVRACARAGRS